jgi:uncharacterized protein (DUF736 family)
VFGLKSDRHETVLKNTVSSACSTNPTLSQPQAGKRKRERRPWSCCWRLSARQEHSAKLLPRRRSSRSQATVHRRIVIWRQVGAAWSNLVPTCRRLWGQLRRLWLRCGSTVVPTGEAEEKSVPESRWVRHLSNSSSHGHQGRRQAKPINHSSRKATAMRRVRERVFRWEQRTKEPS